MPFNLASLLLDRAAVTVTFDSGDLHVEFYPAKLTGQMLVEYAAADLNKLREMDAERVAAVLASPTDILLALLASWDMALPDADGNLTVLPIDRPTLSALGVKVQWAILNGIMTAQRQTGEGEAVAPEASASAPASGATSQPTAQ